MNHAGVDIATASAAWIRSQNYVEMTFRQAALLSVLCDERGQLRAGELARRLNLKKPVVSRIIKTFQAAGLARRIRGRDDRRSAFVEPTARGRFVRKAMRELAAATSNEGIDLGKAAMAWIGSPTYVEMSLRQAALLSVLCDEAGPHRGRKLVERLGLHSSVVTEAAIRFEALAIAQRARRSNDRRSVVIEVTALGRSLREAMKGRR